MRASDGGVATAGTPGPVAEAKAPVTIAALHAKRARGEPIVMLTAYEFVSARVAEAAGVDIALVGDSGAMTVLGLPSTRDVTLDEVLMLVRAVRRGLRTPLLVGDMPFGSYEASDELALATARRFVAAGCEAVKLEGAGPIADRARALVTAGIPVMGHVGLTPQSSGGPEGMRVQGRTAEAAVQVVREAQELERAGCFSLVLEAIPADVAAMLTERVGIPTIGIGAGAAVDGQVLVFHDLLGLWAGHVPKFVRRYADLEPLAVDAVRRWSDDVRARRFPDAAESYGIPAAELAALKARLADER